eukprot:TRINITY_DN15044_c0_g1_i1.p1 TRINITY_DN15044_c0_g1~~TRINITY_DN15044_c0_g1_i1.p1  ORF type:complete len:919 (+),score=125.18 TRINITY_DN15044_c0_g1_i1:59-2815(+)
MNKIVLLALLLHGASALLQMPKWFGDNMVLEANHESGDLARLNGKADAGEKVTITSLGRTYNVSADENGDWTVTLEPKGLNQASSEITITDTQGTKLTASNVLYGDIFFCSGGSNLMYPLKDAFNSSEEAEVLIKYSNYVNYRFFMTPMSTASTPQFDLAPGTCSLNSGKCLEWVNATTAYSTNFIQEFSAVCYLTARDITRIHNMNLEYPQKAVGLIQSGWRDTPIEAWVPKEGIAMCANAAQGSAVPASAFAPSSLYNSMIHPFKYVTLRAVLWYQGETDIQNGMSEKEYACYQQALIKTWRYSKHMGDFGFMIMQLAPTVGQSSIVNGDGDNMFNVRIAQEESNPHYEGPVAATGVVPALDLGGYGIDGFMTPPNKNEMAKRMALQTVHVAYGVQGIMNNTNADPVSYPWSSYWSGPVLTSIAKTDTQIIVTYSSESSMGLYFKETTSMNINGSVTRCSGCCQSTPPFEILLSNTSQWVAVPLSDVYVSNNQITIIAKESVSAIRYSYGNFVGCTVANSNNLPGSPFMFTFDGEEKQRNVIKDKAIYGPPMGWDSWNFAHCNVDEQMAISVIEAMLKNGMKDAGYTYINIDDCWAGSRSPNGSIIPDPARFPSGIKYLADYAHARGMKLGLYTARAALTCMYRPGSFDHEAIDAQTYCDWGVDYLKIDICYGPKPKEANESWIKFRNGFDACYEKTGHRIFENVDSCDDPNGCGQWIAKIANSWTTGGSDIQANWQQILNKAMHNNQFSNIAMPNHYNDADMLEVGNAGVSHIEEMSHMALWSIMSSPLLAGTDVRNLSNTTLQVFLNKDVISVNQDLGYDSRVQGSIINSTSSSQVWSKRLQNGDYAVLLLNIMDATNTDVTIEWSALGIQPDKVLVVKDIWEQKTILKTSTKYTAKQLSPHASQYVLLSASSW